MEKTEKVGTYKNPARTEDGGLHVDVPVDGTVWLNCPAGGPLLALDSYGGQVELVVYGQGKVTVRAAGSELDSGAVFDPATNTATARREDGETWERDVYVDGGFVTVTMRPGSNREALREARKILDRMGLTNVKLSGAVFGKKAAK